MKETFCTSSHDLKDKPPERFNAFNKLIAECRDELSKKYDKEILDIPEYQFEIEFNKLLFKKISISILKKIIDLLYDFNPNH